MLVLSRCRNEALVIGEGENAVTVRVLEMSCGKVRLGITAPKDMLVLRDEVLRRVQDQERAARASAAQASGG